MPNCVIAQCDLAVANVRCADSTLYQLSGPHHSIDPIIRSANRRKEAAAWVQQLTGCTVTLAPDAELRAALRDGTLLCQILHHLKPGVIPQVSIQ